MNDLLWYVLGYLDGSDRPGQRGGRCCCALGLLAAALCIAGAVTFLLSR